MSDPTVEQNQSPLGDPAPFVIVLSVIYLGIYALGDYLPQSLWGVNILQWVDLTLKILVFVIGIAGAAIILTLAETIKLTKTAKSLLVYLIAPAILLGIFYYFSVATHFLGDGILRARELESGFVVLPTEPLAYFVNYISYKTLGPALGLSAVQAIMLISYLGGLLYYYALLPLVAELSEERSTRVFYFLLLFFSGTTLLFCGYSETYMLLPALIATYMFTGIKAIRGKLSPVIPILVLFLLVLFHFKSLIFAPSILILAYFAHREGKKYVWPVVVGTFVLIVLAIAFVPAISKLPRVPITAFVFGLSDKGENYPFLSMQHFADVYSELMLTGGVALVLILSLISFKRFRESFTKPEVLYVAASAPGALGMLIFLYSELGFAVDWDLFSVVGLTLNLVMVTALAFSEGLQLGRIARIALASVGITSFVAFAAVNEDFETMVNRHVDLLELYGGNQAAIGFETMGNYLNTQGYEDLAVRMWKRSVRIRPHVRMYANLGQMALNQGNLTEAEYYNLKGMELDSTVYVLHTNLGLAYARMQKFDRAEPYLKRAVELAPNSGSVRHNYAVAAIHAQQYELAEELERQALKLEPNVPMYMVALGAALIGQGKAEEARDLLIRVLQIAPNNPQAVLNLANAFGKLEQHNSALRVLQDYIRAFPESPYTPQVRQKAAAIKQFIDSIRTKN